MKRECDAFLSDTLSFLVRLLGNIVVRMFKKAAYCLAIVIFFAIIFREL